jgi:hypothetical protein
MSERCIKRDRNYNDAFFMSTVVIVAIAILLILGVTAIWCDWGALVVAAIFISTIAIGFPPAAYSDVLAKRWRGIGYHNKLIHSSGVSLMFDTRSYDDYKLIFKDHLEDEGLEFRSDQVSIVHSIIVVTLKRDIDYLKLIGCIEESERVISLELAKIKLENKNFDDEYKRLEQNIKLMDEKNKDRYCKKF